MNIDDFKRILISFADKSEDILFDKGDVIAIIRGETIQIQLKNMDGDLYIIEDKLAIRARLWISKRLAQMEQLAERIKEYTLPISSFVNPTGYLLDDIDIDPSEIEVPTENVTECLSEKLGHQIPGTTSVVYLTSDAGEGKTTIINHIAIKQAELFKKKQTDWLVVPIPLEGRPALRIDDIVIASLVNRFRFRLFYYESFIELVKLGLIVPAFDGFEEMFMVSSSGEALSATGELMRKLGSSGNVLIAARQAYFDYKGFGAQAKLFDTFSNESVAFSRLAINRWSKEQFKQYAIYRNVGDGEQIYELVKARLKSDVHPLLTRPVLVNRLFDVVQNTNDLENLSSALVNTTEYFPKFVKAIIEREAYNKWVDATGDLKPLLSITEHYELLAILSEEMWLNNTSSLPLSIIDLLADLYCETKKFSVKISRQVKERLKQHALIVKAGNTNSYKFDHEEFQEYFLGVCFYNSLKLKKVTDLKNLLRKGLVFGQAVDSFVNFAKSEEVIVLTEVVDIFNKVQFGESSSSYIKENCGKIILRILSQKNCEGIELLNYQFPIDCLLGVELTNLSITNSFFQTTSLSGTKFNHLVFKECTFDGIEFDKLFSIQGETVLKDCIIASVRNVIKDIGFYDPYNIKKELIDFGFKIDMAQEIIPAVTINEDVDEDLEIVERALRRFIRSTHINDNVFRLRLSGQADHFLHNLLPLLIDNKVLSEVEYNGSGQKRRFKLSVPFDKINHAIKESNGNFSLFLKNISGRQHTI